jgi:threonyl-tRNA synthetase
MSKETNDKNIEYKRHSLSHLLAKAVLNLYPDTMPTLGPAIDTGFYYDFEFKTPFKEEDLLKVEKEMKKVIKGWKDFSHKEVSKEEAIEYFKDNPYKLELIDEISTKGEKITLYTVGSGETKFTDLCRGGHFEDMSKVAFDSFKLQKTAGAYWRGDEKNKMLTRIYGLAFDTKEELEKYEFQIEEAKKRDHRKLGKELDLFTFSEHIGSGLPLYTPKGALIRRLLTGYTEDLQVKADYTQVWTPQIAKAELFKISGHYDKYKEDMFRVVSNYSDEEFYLKPMNCPQHTQIYASKPRSYRDLPLRYSDFAMLYRDERPGELNGLARVRAFSQDDCHIFCREDQVDEEIDKALEMTKTILNTFGFKYRYRLSTRDPEHPEKYFGNKDTWDKVEKWAEDIMKRHNIEYFPGPGEAAFYAPKMDLMATDALGREWQLSTVQIDFVMPERFDLKYTDKDGKEKRPVMLHRAIIGSPERFMMILIEHFAGNFPLWLSPVQVKVLPVRDTHNEEARKVYNILKEAGIRVEIDDRDENLGKKVRETKNEKVPYWIVIGDKDIEAGKVTLESRDTGNLGQLDIEEVLEKFKKEISIKK